MLAPDFLNVVVSSKGVRDCAEFVSAITGLHHSRTDANTALVLWATLYFKRMFTVSPLSLTFQMPTLLYFANDICSTLVKHARSEANTILIQFVHHMSTFMLSIDPTSAGSMFLGLHNVRNVFHDEDSEILKSGRFIYIKVDQIVNVFMRQGIKYNARDVINAVKEDGPHRLGACVTVRGRWHDISEFPVSTRRFDAGLHTKHLMPEEQIPPSQYVRNYAGYIISKKWFDDTVTTETTQDPPSSRRTKSVRSLSRMARRSRTSCTTRTGSATAACRRRLLAGTGLTQRRSPPRLCASTPRRWSSASTVPPSTRPTPRTRTRRSN